MPRTIIDVDRELLELAKQQLGETTNTGAVNAALRQVVRGEAARRLLDRLARLDDESAQALSSVRDQW